MLVTGPVIKMPKLIRVAEVKREQGRESLKSPLVLWKMKTDLRVFFRLVYVTGPSRSHRVRVLPILTVTGFNQCTIILFREKFHRKCVDPGSSLNCCARNSSVPVSLCISCLKQTPSSIVSLNCLSKTLEDMANVQMADGSEKPTRIIAVAVDHSEWSERAFECECKSYLSFPAAGVRTKSTAMRTNGLQTDEAFCFNGLMDPYVRVSFEILVDQKLENVG